MTDFETALTAYHAALADYLERLSQGKLDDAYRQAGRRARRALNRCYRLAAQYRINWTPGTGARSFY